jgi:hypothetical protein
MRRVRRTNAQELLAAADDSLLDVVDHVLNKGVVLTGEVVLGVAGVDLIYLRLSALLCAVDALDRPASGSRATAVDGPTAPSRARAIARTTSRSRTSRR